MASNFTAWKAESPAAKIAALRSLPSSVPRAIVLELLEQAIRGLDAPVRLEAVHILGSLGSTGVPLLLEALRQPDSLVRRTAATILGKAGKDGAPAVPLLAELLSDSCEKVRMAAAVALGGIGPLAAPAIGPLLRALAGTNLILARLAAQALSRIGMDAASALTGALRSPDRYVRREAAWALGEIGPPLRRLSQTPLPASGYSSLPLPRISTRTKRTEDQPTVPLALAGKDRLPLSEAVPADGRDAIPELKRALTDPELKVREAAGLALARIFGTAAR
jgi:hypothetical protein